MTGEFPSVLHRLWNNASTGTLERLDPAECIARYATSIQSAQSNVLLVASDDQVLPPNENPLINGSHACGRWKFSAMSAMARDTARNSFDWICSGMDTKRPCSLGIDAIRDSSAESWLMGPGAGWPVKYCLSERADPTCKLHFEPTIGTIVTILNFGKPPSEELSLFAGGLRTEQLMSANSQSGRHVLRSVPRSRRATHDNGRRSRILPGKTGSYKQKQVPLGLCKSKNVQRRQRYQASWGRPATLDLSTISMEGCY